MDLKIFFFFFGKAGQGCSVFSSGLEGGSTIPERCWKLWGTLMGVKNLEFDTRKGKMKNLDGLSHFKRSFLLLAL